MGLLSALKNTFSKRNVPEELAFHEAFGQLLQAASVGKGITKQSAARVAAVYACRTAICESVAMLPVTVYKEKKSGNETEIDRDHELSEILREAPNDFQDPFQFFETMQLNLLDWGNAYAMIERSRMKQIKRLVPLLPERVEVQVEGSLPVYYYKDPDTDEKRKIPSEKIFHIKNQSRDGFVGLSPIEVAGDAIKFAASLQDHGNNLFDKGAMMAGLLSADFEFDSDEQRKRLVESFKKFMGKANSGGVALLEKGLDYKQLQMNMKDAQFIESKQFSVLDIARIYRVPPHMIQDLSQGASFASIEQQSINFVQYTIQPWVTRWERALRRQLLLKRDSEHYVRFNVSALIRGDLKTRTEAIVQQLQYGLLTLNEARNLIDANPHKEEMANAVLVSHNLRPLSELGKEPEEETDLDSDGQISPTQNPEEPDLSVSEERALPLFQSTIKKLERRRIEGAKRLFKKGATEEEFGEFLEREAKITEENLSPVVSAFRDDHQGLLSAFVSAYTEKQRAEFEKRGLEALATGEPWTEELVGALLEIIFK